MELEWRTLDTYTDYLFMTVDGERFCVADVTQVKRPEVEDDRGFREQLLWAVEKSDGTKSESDVGFTAYVCIEAVPDEIYNSYAYDFLQIYEKYIREVGFYYTRDLAKGKVEEAVRKHYKDFKPVKFSKAEKLMSDVATKFVWNNWDKIDFDKVDLEDTLECKNKLLAEIKTNVHDVLWIFTELSTWGMIKNDMDLIEKYEFETYDNNDYYILKFDEMYVKLEWVDKVATVKEVKPKTKTVTYFE